MQVSPTISVRTWGIALVLVSGTLAPSAYAQSSARASQPRPALVCAPATDNAGEGCIKGDKYVRKDAVVGILSSRQYLTKRQVKYFRIKSNAVAGGYSAFVAPTPTATPTATATPLVSSYQGLYETTDGSPLLRVSGSDTCSANGFTQQTAVSLDLTVLHTSGSSEIKGELNLTLPSGLATPVPAGQRLYGAADGSSFDIKGAYTAATVSGIPCTAPVIETTFSGSSVTSSTAVIRRTDRVICPGSTVVDCRQVWEGTVTKTAF